MKRLLNEVGVLLCILIIFAAVVVVAFRDRVPFDAVVPVADEYVSEKDQYIVSSQDRLSNVKEQTVIRKADTGDIADAESEVRIITGKPTPFGQIPGISNLPTEVVGDGAGNTEENISDDSIVSQNASGPEGVIQDIENAENESAKDAFERRTQQN